jgi:serine/threonine-protein kinase RsbW
MESRLVLELPNDLRSIGEVVERVVGEFRGCGRDPRRLRLNLRVGLTEALSNAMLYGNRRSPSKRVRLEVHRSDCRITLKVTDEGGGFAPALIPDPTTPENVVRPDGRGLFLMRELLDEVHYNEQGNSVTLVLYIDSGGRLGGLARL